MKPDWKDVLLDAALVAILVGCLFIIYLGAKA